MGIIKNKEIINWILKHPQAYPGQHNQIHNKIFTKLSQKQKCGELIDLNKQFFQILKTCIDFIVQSLQQQKCSICIPQLGTFFLFIRTQSNVHDKKNLQIHKMSNNISKKGSNNYLPLFMIKFQPTSFLSKSLYSNYYDQKLIRFEQSKQYQSKIFQIIESKRIQWVDCSQIGARLLLPKQKIVSHLNVLNKAISDLTQLNKVIQLDLQILKLKIANKKMTQENNIGFILKIQDTKNIKLNNEQRKKLNQKQNRDIWSDKYEKMWHKSLMSGIRQQTNVKQINQHFNKGFELKFKQMFLR